MITFPPAFILDAMSHPRVIPFRRWINKRQLPQISIEQSHYCSPNDEWTYVYRAIGRNGVRIGKLLILSKQEPGKSAVAHNLTDASLYLHVEDLVIEDKAWRQLGIGSRIFNTAIHHLKSTIPEDTVVQGWVTPSSQQGFWQRFGFKFQVADSEVQMAALLQDLQTTDADSALNPVQ